MTYIVILMSFQTLSSINYGHIVLFKLRTDKSVSFLPQDENEKDLKIKLRTVTVTKVFINLSKCQWWENIYCLTVVQT